MQRSLETLRQRPHLSVSALKLWLSCPRKFRLHYVDKAEPSHRAISLVFGHAWHELGLQLGTGIYGSTFFMLTGFHGLHVLVGAIMLVVIWLRCLAGHFTPRQHFAFEAVAWYWHFVDVVWLGLFIFVYWI